MRIPTVSLFSVDAIEGIVQKKHSRPSIGVTQGDREASQTKRRDVILSNGCPLMRFKCVRAPTKKQIRIAGEVEIKTIRHIVTNA